MTVNTIWFRFKMQNPSGPFILLESLHNLVGDVRRMNIEAGCAQSSRSG